MRRGFRTVALLLAAALFLPILGCAGGGSQKSVEDVLGSLDFVESWSQSGDVLSKSLTLCITADEENDWSFLLDLDDYTGLKIIIQSTNTRDVDLSAVAYCPDLEWLTIGASCRFASLTLSAVPPSLERLTVDSEWGLNGRIRKLDIGALNKSRINCVVLTDFFDEAELNLGGGFETIIFNNSTPDLAALAAAKNLKELVLRLDEPIDLSPLKDSASLSLLELDARRYDEDAGSVDADFDFVASAAEWDLSPLVGSNVETLVLGCHTPTTVLETLAGAENIKTLAAARYESGGLAALDALPNLENFVFALTSGWDSAVFSRNDEMIELDAQTVAGLPSYVPKEPLENLLSRGAKLFGYTTVGYTVAQTRPTAAFYEWYYAR